MCEPGLLQELLYGEPVRWITPQQCADEALGLCGDLIPDGVVKVGLLELDALLQRLVICFARWVEGMIAG